MEGIVEIEVVVYGHDASTGDYIAKHEEKEIRLDLISADLIDFEEDIHGKVKLEGVWDMDIFVVENIILLN